MLALRKYYQGESRCADTGGEDGDENHAGYGCDENHDDGDDDGCGRGRLDDLVARTGLQGSL